MSGPLGVVEYAAASHAGVVRRSNEDALLARPPLFVIADGMGGARAGEVASRLAVETFDTLAGTSGLPEELLRRTISDANAAIHTAAERDPAVAGMGTTVTAALVAPTAVSFGHVGDSRAYLWRDGVLRQLSDDHSLVGELLRRGALTEDEAAGHPQRSIITRVVGTDGAVEVDTFTIEARPDDVFLLCSDGLTDMLRDAEIGAVLGDAASLADAARELVRRANGAGGVDNVTAVLFRVGTGAPAPPPASGTPEMIFVDEPPRRSRRLLRRLAFLMSALVVGGAIAAAALVGLRQAHFVGATASGRVAIYQGLPFDLAGDLRLYRQVAVTSLPVQALTPEERAALFDHAVVSLAEARARIDALPATAYHGGAS